MFKKITIALFFCLPMLMISCKKKGCIDQVALNYNSEAKKDDGSCKYATTGTLEITVVDESGIKQSGKFVSLYKGTYDDYFGTGGKTKEDFGTTDSNGNVTFNKLTPGAYTTTIADNQHDPMATNMTIVAGQTKKVTMTLEDY